MQPKSDTKLENHLADLSVILFPHTQISLTYLEKILTCFGQLTICQPWLMEDAISTAEIRDDASVRIQRPRESLKPKGDLKRLVSEFQLWVLQNQDKGYRAFLTATQKESTSEASLWEIRQMISKAVRDKHDNTLEDKAFKWHLVLYLAREFEKNRSEAENMLYKLQNQESPLKGALENDPAQKLLEDSPLMEAKIRVDQYQLRQVFEAWFGLFGEQLSDHDSLITLDPHVISHASEILESGKGINQPELNTEHVMPPDPVTGQPSFFIKHLPQLPEGGDTLKDPVLKGLSGKNIILMEV